MHTARTLLLLRVLGCTGAAALWACGAESPTELAAQTQAIAGSVTTFPLPAAHSFPGAITTGPDGALWFLETGQVGRITTAGALREFPAPVAFLSGSLTTGPDGALWFTNPGTGVVVRFTTSGAATQFTLPENTVRKVVDHPQGITTGPDGALWFTVQTISRSTLQVTGSKINRLTTAGALSEFSLPAGTTKTTIPRLGAIVSGPDGALWASDDREGRIWRLTTGGALTSFTAPAAAPLGLTKGPDGALWFTASAGTAGRLGRVTTAGAFTTFPITGGPNGLTLSSALVKGSDGDLWFSDYDLTSSSGAILRATTAGAVTRFPFPLYNEIDGFAAGPDGAVWFSRSDNQSGAASIGRITTH